MNLRLVLSTLVVLAACSEGERDSGESGASGFTTPGTSAPGTSGASGSSGSSGTADGTADDTTGTDATGASTHDHPATSHDWTGGTTWEPGTGTWEPGTTADDSGGGDDPSPGCMQYCAAMMSTCTGANGQYSSIDSCLGVCATLPPGAPGETAGNSLACRAYHAGMAVNDPETHCVHAGPGGAGVCGSNCEGFCAIAVATCPNEHPDTPTCLATCGGFAGVEKYDIGDAAGNTFACRLYHLTVAATDEGSALQHCGHTIAASPTCK